MTLNRKKEITQYIQTKEQASLDELCSVFGVSKNTVRRDINDLEALGVLRKVYGGVRALEKPASAKTMISFTDRSTKYVTEKNSICEYAARLVEDGDVIFIDSGTTVVNMIEHLAAKKNLTVLTNNLNVIIKASRFPRINTISFGGQLNLETASFLTNIFPYDYMQRFNINKAFMAATGVSIETGATNTSPMEAEMKRNIVQKSDMSILLVDKSKFDRAALLTFAGLNRFKHVVSDSAPPQKYVDYFLKNGVKLILE